MFKIFTCVKGIFQREKGKITEIYRMLSTQTVSALQPDNKRKNHSKTKKKRTRQEEYSKIANDATTIRDLILTPYKYARVILQTYIQKSLYVKYNAYFGCVCDRK